MGTLKTLQFLIKTQMNILNQLVDDIYTDGILFSYRGSKTTVNEYGQNYFILNDVSISLKKEIYEKYKKIESSWLKAVPSHWEIRRIASVFEQRKERNKPIKTEEILT